MNLIGVWKYVKFAALKLTFVLWKKEILRSMKHPVRCFS